MQYKVSFTGFIPSDYGVCCINILKFQGTEIDTLNLWNSYFKSIRSQCWKSYYYCAYLNKKMKIFSVFVYTDDACSLFKLTFFSSSLTLSKLIYWYMYMYFLYSLSSPMILSIFYSCVKKLVNGGNRNLINWGILSTKKFVLCRWHCKEINIGCRIN